MSPTYKIQERQLIRNELIASLVSVRNILILDQIKNAVGRLSECINPVYLFYSIKIRI